MQVRVTEPKTELADWRGNSFCKRQKGPPSPTLGGGGGGGVGAGTDDRDQKRSSLVIPDILFFYDFTVHTHLYHFPAFKSLFA